MAKDVNTVLATEPQHLGGLAALDREQLRTYGTGISTHETANLGGSMAVLVVSVPQGAPPSWAPTTIGAVDEIFNQAFWTYYGRPSAAHPDWTDPNFWSQRLRNFHVLPELAAAAAIELKVADNPSPLHYAVIQRLTGSDPDAAGPRLLELFYLLRSKNHLREVAVPGIDGYHGLVLDLADETVTIESRDPDAERDQLFGHGRVWVRRFDAFCDLMLYDGRPMGAAAASAYSVPEARLIEWRALAIDRKLAKVQRAAFLAWSEATKDECTSDEEEMLRLLDEDATLMAAGVAGADWKRAVTTIIKTGTEQRRARAK
jgi:hypothetical protein